MNDIAESEWTAGTRDGDAIAWQNLVAAHQAAVFRLAYLLLGSRHDAEDVAQETFLRAYRSRARFDAERSPRPWLLQICANLARNRRRSLSRQLDALQRLFANRPVIEPQSLVPFEAAAERLWQAIRRLRSDDQQVLYLRFFLDLTLAESAQATGVAEGTVKSRTNRALRRLRAVIEHEFPELSTHEDLHV